MTLLLVNSVKVPNITPVQDLPLFVLTCVMGFEEWPLFSTRSSSVLGLGVGGGGKQPLVGTTSGSPEEGAAPVGITSGRNWTEEPHSEGSAGFFSASCPPLLHSTAEEVPGWSQTEGDQEHALPTASQGA